MSQGSCAFDHEAQHCDFSFGRLSNATFIWLRADTVVVDMEGGATDSLDAACAGLPEPVVDLLRNAEPSLLQFDGNTSLERDCLLLPISSVAAKAYGAVKPKAKSGKLVAHATMIQCHYRQALLRENLSDSLRKRLLFRISFIDELQKLAASEQKAAVATASSSSASTPSAKRRSPLGSGTTTSAAASSTASAATVGASLPGSQPRKGGRPPKKPAVAAVTLPSSSGAAHEEASASDSIGGCGVPSHSAAAAAALYFVSPSASAASARLPGSSEPCTNNNNNTKIGSKRKRVEVTEEEDDSLVDFSRWLHPQGLVLRRASQTFLNTYVRVLTDTGKRNNDNEDECGLVEWGDRCVCTSPDVTGGPLLCCDYCSSSAHYACVGITPGSIFPEDSWACWACAQTLDGPHMQLRIPLPVPIHGSKEALWLQRGVTAWRKHMQQQRQQVGVPEVPGPGVVRARGGWQAVTHTRCLGEANSIAGAQLLRDQYLVRRFGADVISAGGVSDVTAARAYLTRLGGPEYAPNQQYTPRLLAEAMATNARIHQERNNAGQERGSGDSYSSSSSGNGIDAEQPIGSSSSSRSSSTAAAASSTFIPLLGLAFTGASSFHICSTSSGSGGSSGTPRRAKKSGLAPSGLVLTRLTRKVNSLISSSSSRRSSTGGSAYDSLKGLPSFSVTELRVGAYTASFSSSSSHKGSVSSSSSACGISYDATAALSLSSSSAAVAACDAHGVLSTLLEDLAPSAGFSANGDVTSDVIGVEQDSATALVDGEQLAQDQADSFPTSSAQQESAGLSSSSLLQSSLPVRSTSLAASLAYQFACEGGENDSGDNDDEDEYGEDGGAGMGMRPHQLQHGYAPRGGHDEVGGGGDYGDHSVDWDRQEGDDECDAEGKLEGSVVNGRAQVTAAEAASLPSSLWSPLAVPSALSSSSSAEAALGGGIASSGFASSHQSWATYKLGDSALSQLQLPPVRPPFVVSSASSSGSSTARFSSASGALADNNAKDEDGFGVSNSSISGSGAAWSTPFGASPGTGTGTGIVVGKRPFSRLAVPGLSSLAAPSDDIY